MAADFLRTRRIAAVCHGFLLSHAGVARRFWPREAAPDTAGQTEAFIKRSTVDWLNRLDRGADSPLWLDWDNEFVDDLAVPQLVGHTRGREARRKHRSWCLDGSQSCAGLPDPVLGLRVVKI